MKTPRAAAIAGIVFSLLLISSLWLLRVSVPMEPARIAAWLRSETSRANLALNLIPFAGVAFLWFLGVMRDRLGAQEDRFFATVLLGSGLMFLGMLFVAAAALEALVWVHADGNGQPGDTLAVPLIRRFIFDLMHVYAFKLAGVFMMATSTLLLRTGVAARWIAFLGYAGALFLLIGSNFLDTAILVFPLWILLLSGYVLVDNYHRREDGAAR